MREGLNINFEGSQEGKSEDLDIQYKEIERFDALAEYLKFRSTEDKQNFFEEVEEVSGKSIFELRKIEDDKMENIFNYFIRKYGKD